MTDVVFIGIEIGGTKLQLVAGDAHRRGPAQRCPADVDRANGRRRDLRQIEAGLAELRERARGRVDAHRRRLWRAGRLADRPHRPVAPDRRLGESSPSATGWPSERRVAGGRGERRQHRPPSAKPSPARDAGSRPVFYVQLRQRRRRRTGDRRGAIYHGAPARRDGVRAPAARAASGETVESRCSGWAVDEPDPGGCARAPRDSTLARLVAMDPGGEVASPGRGMAAGDALAERMLDERRRRHGVRPVARRSTWPTRT